MKKEWLFFCTVFIVTLCSTVIYPPSISGFNYCDAYSNVVAIASVYSRQLMVADNTQLSILQAIAEQNAETLSGMAQCCANNENIHSIFKEKIPAESIKRAGIF
ncbi:MAG: hypothetical protein ABIR15_05695 [Chitinophagaceae bacterium]